MAKWSNGWSRSATNNTGRADSPRGSSVTEEDSLTNSDNSASGGAHLNIFPFSQSLDVAHRRLAEESTIFTIELTDTFVSNLKGDR